MDLLLLVATPLTGAAVLGVLGARRFAPELNITFSLITFVAACALTMHVISAGALTFSRDQFFIDAFNVFLVTLTALVGLTTAIFSRPYMRVEMEHGRVRAAQLRLYQRVLLAGRTAGNAYWKGLTVK